MPQAKKIILDVEISDDELCSLLAVGVDGYIPYAQVRQMLLRAVRAVAQDHLWVSPRVLEHYVSYSNRLSHTKRKTNEDLTCRENEIVGLLQKRLSNKEISATLGISEGTVKFHLARIFEKLQIHGRHEVVEVFPIMSRNSMLGRQPAGSRVGSQAGRNEF